MKDCAYTLLLGGWGVLCSKGELIESELIRVELKIVYNTMFIHN